MKRRIRQQITAMAKEPTRGVFWLIDGELTSFPYYDDDQDGVANSGLTYNHKRLWPYIQDEIKSAKGQPYNYYPRGRVDFTGKGRPVIYMSPHIDESFIGDIKVDFGLRSEPKIVYDHSNHYFCYLDEGWKPDR